MTASFESLESHLANWTEEGADRGLPRASIVEVVLAVADACRDISHLIRKGALAGAHGAVVDDSVPGDETKALDLQTNDIFVAALRETPVAVVASEEMATPLPVRPGAPMAVAVDPLDGSSNIDANLSIGSIFTVLPMLGDIDETFRQPGTVQLAAGYSVYGPQTSLVLTLGAGTQIFTLDPESDRFLLTHGDVQIPERTSEFSINASNYRHWSERIRSYIDDCLAGDEGPRGKNFNMRWNASLVAECHRILSRGGVYLYPGDARIGYGLGRLRLVYEAHPVAWLIEQAGGIATTGWSPILDQTATDLHQRSPLIFGSREEVERVQRYKVDDAPWGERSPLFAHRGLFRA